MAVLWEKQQGDCRYEVRQAGNSLRLYTNGVLHTQFNPERRVTGSVWDLLTLPALFAPPGQIQRVLLLGVGGGAVIHQLRHWFAPGLIIGVELNPLHLQVAKEFFQLQAEDTVLYEDDAKQWLRRYQGPPFDLLIDDLYSDNKGEPERAVLLDDEWCQLLREHVADSGLLVVNTVSWQELKQSALMDESVGHNFFRHGFRFSTPNCYNAVGVFSNQKLRKAAFNDRLENIAELASGLHGGLLRFQSRKLR